MKTEESDAWNYYQAKKNRGYMYAATRASGSPLQGGARQRSGREDGKARCEVEREVEGYDADAEKLQEEAKKLQHDGHVSHISSNFFDLGELGIEIALVLCSVALLAKRKEFWLIGITVGALGFIVAMGGFFVEELTAAAQDDRLGLGTWFGERRSLSRLTSPSRVNERLTHRATKTPHSTAIVAVTHPGRAGHVHSFGEFIEEASGAREKAKYAYDCRRVHGVFTEVLLFARSPPI